MDSLPDPLHENSIQLYFANVNGNASEDSYYWSILSHEECVRATKIKNDLLRAQYVEIHARVREVLARIICEYPHKIPIATTRYGKPYLVSNPELTFNLSHTGGFFILGLGWHRQLGVDVEMNKQRAHLAELAKRCFAAEEMDYWRGLPEIEKISEFYRLWTRKEAFVKATGRGLAMGMENCVVNPDSFDRFLRVPSDYGKSCSWRAHEISLQADICSVLVTDKETTEITVTAIDKKCIFS